MTDQERHEQEWKDILAETKKMTRIFRDSHVDGDLRRWNESDNVVPPWVFEEAGMVVSSDYQLAYDEETARELAEYRERMMDYEPGAEELFEMRAAFGEGETVVNVITGKKIQL